MEGHLQVIHCFLTVAPQPNSQLRPVLSHPMSGDHGFPWTNLPSGSFGDTMALGKLFHRKSEAQWPQPWGEASLCLASCPA